MTWLHDKTTDVIDRIKAVKEEDAFPFFRPFENVGSRVKVGSGSYINFTSNDYLGLSRDPRLIRRSCKGTKRYGTGLGSARPQATLKLHDELEQRLARWLGYQDCAVYTTGYQSLVGLLTSFLDDDVSVVVDKLSHAAILDGVYLAQGMHPDLEIRYFKHNNPKSLDKVLKRTEHSKKLVVVEGLYSVDGDYAPLADFVQVCRDNDAVIMVDDAHGLGALGPTGRGVGEIHGVLEEIDLLVGTFSKSFGCIGGFVCADKDLIEFMKLSAKSFMFSATLPVAQVEAAAAALDIIESDHSYFRKLERNRDFFRAGLLDIGVDLGGSDTHITPIMLREEGLTLKAAAYLYHGAGVIMMPFIFPGVAKGHERLRCNVTAAHSKAEMGYTLEAVAEIGQMLGFLPKGAKTRATNVERALWLAEHKLQGMRNAGVGYVAKELAQASRKIVDWSLGKANGKPNGKPSEQQPADEETSSDSAA